MPQALPNGLSQARSAYLRSARHQPVRWMEWRTETFALAREQDKPILLDIGAVWCHWCHVMDRESYEDDETARLINEHFIAIKVDRDERPDIDSRYQAAVAAISGQGGWPLTAFLMPDGRPFFGGTYFPPLDAHGRPSLRRVLMTMAEAYERRRDEVLDSAQSVMAAVEHSETFDGAGQPLSASLSRTIAQTALDQFDPRHGGFGTQPKFPHSSALDLLLHLASQSVAGQADGEQNRAARRAAMTTLEKMARGGVYDQLAGGFHRYSVDERWVVPHFEKMLYDNAGLLLNYVHAFASSGEPASAHIVRDIMRWVDEWLSDRERGGFYASQDADVSLEGGVREGDGDYFTWTEAEAAAVLTPEELAVAGSWFDIGPIGDMQHNFQKNVLHLEIPLLEVARSARIAPEHAAALLQSARTKLYTARKLRSTPYIDRTVYTGWNGMMISAYLAAGRILQDANASDFALQSLVRVLGTAWDGDSLAHIVSYGEGSDSGDAVPGLLEDYLFIAQASLDAWESTGDARYFRASLALAESALSRFYDSDRGGFFDTEAHASDKTGALAMQRKPLQDAPSPAGNSVAASLLLRLAELTGRDDLRAKAQATLECFAGVAEHLGLNAGSFALAVERFILPPVLIVVIGADQAAADLEAAALRPFLVNRTILRLQTMPLDSELPPALAATLPHLSAQPGSFAVVCSGFACQPPVATVAALNRLLNG
jgi:uncharacterized protein YyaL (SSP411 family)